MANFTSRGEPFRNGHNSPGSTHTAATAEAPWTNEEALRQEIQRLTAENQQLLGLVAGTGGEKAELERLRTENAELLAEMAELEQMVSGGGQASKWAEQQREYEALLEEKSEVIRSLHQKLQEAREAAESPRESSPPSNVSAGSVTDRQLLAVKAELEQQREQLEADEESLMTQMRQMEMSMARERAELARQRAELQRLHNDLKHEIEQAARDGSLRERLNSLQRRQPDAPKQAGTSDATPAPKNTGVFRRLFSSGQ